MANGFHPNESLSLFGEDYTKGNITARGTGKCLAFLEDTLREKEEEQAHKNLDLKPREAELKLHRLSLSPLPLSHGMVDVMAKPDSNPDSNE